MYLQSIIILTKKCDANMFWNLKPRVNISIVIVLSSCQDARYLTLDCSISITLFNFCLHKTTQKFKNASTSE